MAGTGKTIGQPLPPHALQTRAVIRSSVVKAALLRADGAAAEFSAEAKAGAFRPLSSADQAMFEARRLATSGGQPGGTIRIELLHERAFRVRYAPAGAEPPDERRLVVGRLPGPGSVAWEPQGGDWVARSAAGELRVTPQPWRWEWRDGQGRRVCGAGGEEKNYFNQWDAYGLGVAHRCEDGRPIGTECFDLRPGEAVFGLGERFIGLNKTGQRIDLDVSDTKGVTTERSYKSVGFFASSLGYAVFLNHAARMTAWVGAMSACDLQVGIDDGFVDYIVFIGTLKEVLPLYTELTGPPVLPPAWTFGFWQSRISYFSAEETLAVAREMRRHDLPCDVIHVDTHWFSRDWFCDLRFDPVRFPDPAGWMRELKALGIRVSLWQLPYIPEGCELFAELLAVEGFVRNADGSLYDCGVTFVAGFSGRVGVIDFTNPQAVRVWQERLRELFRMGVAAIKTDFGEEAPVDGRYHDGTPGFRAHNLYPLLYNEAAAAVTQEETGGVCVWARSACAGGQRFPVHWGGDSSPNPANVVPQLAGGLSLGLSGFPFWSQDIGGFMGATRDLLLVRWLQWSVFLSHCRIHGFGARELYRFAPDTLRICREFLHLRYRLLPYLLGTAEICAARSLPFARALVVEFQDDPNSWGIADEFLCGEALLVAPLTGEGDERRIYLPPDVWYSWWDGERIDARPAGRWVVRSEPLERLPLFVRAGAIVPLGPKMSHVGEKEFAPLECVIAAREEDGESRFEFPLRSGERCSVVVRWRNGRPTGEVTPRSVEAVFRWMR